MAEERLHKILARAGIASRRAAERLMLDGRVLVNGKIASQLGMKADLERDHIRVDGKLLRPDKSRPLYLAAFKPERMLTTLDDPEGRPTLRQLLAAHGVRERVFPVGRLDWDSDGLLLLTNDGELANRVMRPGTRLEKTYRVKVRGRPAERALERLRRGVTIEGPRGAVRTLPARVEVEREGETTTWLRVGLVEGRQNQIKKMCLAVGHPVRKLRRTALGPISLGRMRKGEVRPLSDAEVRRLRRAVEGRDPGPGGSKRAGKRSRRLDPSD
jgi:pseudouridine synthase